MFIIANDISWKSFRGEGEGLFNGCLVEAPQSICLCCSSTEFRKVGHAEKLFVLGNKILRNF